VEPRPRLHGSRFEGRSRPQSNAPDPAVADGPDADARRVKADARQAARKFHDAVVASDRDGQSVYEGSLGWNNGAMLVPTDDGAAIEPDAVSISHAAGRGLRWSLIGAFVARFGGLGLGMVLARLLTPEDFGLVALFVALPLAFAALRRIGVTLLPIARGLTRPLLAAAAAATLCTIVRDVVPGTALAQLAATGVVGLATYAVLVIPAEQRRQLIVHGRDHLRAARRRGDVTPAVTETPASAAHLSPDTTATEGERSRMRLTSAHHLSRDAGDRLARADSRFAKTDTVVRLAGWTRQ
jgi:hypothetical protein